jgi:hypothetical protein
MKVNNFSYICYNLFTILFNFSALYVRKLGSSIRYETSNIHKLSKMTDC